MLDFDLACDSPEKTACHILLSTVESFSSVAASLRWYLRCKNCRSARCWKYSEALSNLRLKSTNSSGGKFPTRTSSFMLRLRGFFVTHHFASSHCSPPMYLNAGLESSSTIEPCQSMPSPNPARRHLDSSSVPIQRDLGGISKAKCPRSPL